MVEVRPDGGEIVELEDRGVREVGAHHVLVCAADAHAAADTRAADGRDVSKRHGVSVDERAAFRQWYVWTRAEQDDVRDQRRGPFG